MNRSLTKGPQRDRSHTREGAKARSVACRMAIGDVTGNRVYRSTQP
ncbi:MAG: hypothetical protein OJF61_000630 [Rhodanobacteraceae bacterium]|nr:MAG: hypothetical protein OJF61_000630 [Rhodanobacteraceae bacterium]